MESVGGQRVLLPSLIPSRLWEATGRLSGEAGPELMKLSDRHGRQLLLGPTHEESVTALAASMAPLSRRSMPLRIYQVGRSPDLNMRLITY